LSACFVSLPEAQKQTYADLFKIIQSVEVSFDIKRTMVRQMFAGVETRLKRTVRYSSDLNGAVQTEEENVNYLFIKKDGHWYIMGTVKPDLAEKPVRVTEQNMDYINSKMSSMTNLRSTNAGSLPDAFVVSSSARRIYIPAEPGAPAERIGLSTKMQTNETGYRVLWRKEGRSLPFVDIPDPVLDEMTSGVVYFLRTDYLDVTYAVLSSVIYKIRKK
jgi:hypothetical protein